MDFNEDYCTSYIHDRILEQAAIVRKYEEMEIKPLEGVPPELIKEIKKSKTMLYSKAAKRMTDLRVQRAYCLEGLHEYAIKSEFYNDFRFDRRYNEFKHSRPSKVNPWELSDD